MEKCNVLWEGGPANAKRIVWVITRLTHCSRDSRVTGRLALRRTVLRCTGAMLSEAELMELSGACDEALAVAMAHILLACETTA